MDRNIVPVALAIYTPQIATSYNLGLKHRFCRISYPNFFYTSLSIAILCYPIRILDLSR